MVFLHARGDGGRKRRWRLVLVGVVVAVYLMVGMLWIVSGGPVADTLTEATSIPGWLDELVKGVVLVLIAVLVVQVAVMRRRADRLDAALARTHEHARQLAASEDRNALQATALSGTANAVVITGADGTIEWVNPAFETMSGYPSSVAVGATPRLFNSGLQDQGFYRELWETILAGRVWRGQVVNRRSDTQLYTVSQTITPVVADSGEVQHFVAIHEDITERVRAERELEASRLRLQALFDHALDAIVLADDEGRYIEVNPAACELTGYSRDELLAMGAADLASPDQQPAEVANQFDAFVRAGTESGTFAMRHKDGHVVETEFRAVSNIQPGVHLSIIRDVTARNRMLRALTVAEAEFRELAEKAADIVAKLRIDGDGTMQVDYVNPAATTILGYPRDHLYSNPDLLFTMFDQRGAELDDALDMIPTPAEPTRLAMVQAQRADGRLVWLEVHGTLIDPSTSPVTIQIVARDVTTRFETMQALREALRDQAEAADQLRRLNAMKDTFLQSVSHELRTPLTSILGFAQLLTDPRQELAAANTRQFHKRILDNAQRLQRLLDDLLDVDRFTRGAIEPNRVPTDLTELIQRMVHDIELDDHPVQLDLEPVTMGLDAPWVERIVANLLRNIVRHTPPDTRIWIRTHSTTAGVTLTVDDDGPGIPEPDRQRLIEPFQQGTEAADSAQPGTGIGLSLVNAFAQIHGGDLTITESPAGGTRITVNLVHAHSDIPDAAPNGTPPAEST
jgi:PAS domain S-box-containing protein